MIVTLGVEEFQGLYGPFQVSELIIQKVWLHGAFDASRLKDHWGRRVEVLFPGKWNRLAGPDFKDAVLRIDGQQVEGDVEVHFGQKDWVAHGHQRSPDYSRVILHVLYHPLPHSALPTLSYSGAEIPNVSLMPLLWYDLEEYASEDSIIESTRSGNEDAIEALFEYGIEERRDRLARKALERWKLKRHFACQRIKRCGWEGACHMTALEILGYAANRIPMLCVAGEVSLERFRLENPSVEQLWALGGDRWRTLGSRPANYPQRRLAHYVQWVLSGPRWPAALLEIESSLPHGPARDWASGAFRRENEVASLRNRIFANVVFEQVNGSKLDTLVCDGFLPLLSARSGCDFSALWFHWFPGNAPESVIKSLKQLQATQPRRYPLCNGWTQGVLGLRA